VRDDERVGRGREGVGEELEGRRALEGSGRRRLFVVVVVVGESRSRPSFFFLLARPREIPAMLSFKSFPREYLFKQAVKRERRQSAGSR
jgi:hypothetical protein